MTRYFMHPESGCVWKQEDDLPDPYTDGCVEEIDEEQYLSLIKEGYREDTSQ